MGDMVRNAPLRTVRIGNGGGSKFAFHHCKHFWEVAHDDIPDNVWTNVQIPVRSDIATINHLAPFEVRMPSLEFGRELASRITKDPKTPQDYILNMPLPKNASFANPADCSPT